MGTDLLVMVGVDVSKKPISIIPTMAKMNKSQIVLVKQVIETADKAANLAIYGKIESIFELLLQKLGVPMPSYEPELIAMQALTLNKTFSEKCREYKEILDKARAG